MTGEDYKKPTILFPKDSDGISFAEGCLEASSVDQCTLHLEDLFKIQKPSNFLLTLQISTHSRFVTVKISKIY